MRLFPILFLALFLLSSARAGQAKPAPGGMLEKFLAECEKGDMHACGNVGALYAKGLAGGKPDFAAAYTYYKKACEGGANERCERAGYFAFKGQGTEMSKEGAKLFWSRGCEFKDGNCCNSLAILISDGQPTENGSEALAPDLDKLEAWRLWERGCAFESRLACRNLRNGLKKGLKIELSDRTKLNLKKF